MIIYLDIAISITIKKLMKQVKINSLLKELFKSITDEIFQKLRYKGLIL
jgi:hypothetical protein